MTSKLRLDLLILERGLAKSREKARAMIMAGEVLVNGFEITKPGSPISQDAEITIKNKPRFVSRGGEKLAGALRDFQLNVTGRVAADVGASTGGFTDCLLQSGVQRVYAIDVGYGQLDYSLRRDDRVLVMERTNARYVDSLPESVNLVVIDASFISLKLLLPVVKKWLQPEADVVTLVKPQFEAGRQDVGKGGVIRDVHIHRRVLREILSFAADMGFQIRDLKGPAGNTEFLAWLRWIDQPTQLVDIDTLINKVTRPT
jgi:23S rRNA (cytidine1920-2'-O)/16S rRNA (cytidine1409-2'-O)-methyltransferase